MTALSYSWTTFTMKKRENGIVEMMRRTEMTVRRWANMLGPSSHTETEIFSQARTRRRRTDHLETW